MGWAFSIRIRRDMIGVHKIVLFRKITMAETNWEAWLALENITKLDLYTEG